MSSPGMFSFKALFLVRRLEVVGGGGEEEAFKSVFSEERIE